MKSNLKLFRNSTKLLLVSAFLFGCEKAHVYPIEKHSGSKYVVTYKECTFSSNFNLQLKSKDTILWITVLHFDGFKIKEGDTLR